MSSEASRRYYARNQAAVRTRKALARLRNEGVVPTRRSVQTFGIPRTELLEAFAHFVGSSWDIVFVRQQKRKLDRAITSNQ